MRINLVVVAVVISLTAGCRSSEQTTAPKQQAPESTKEAAEPGTPAAEEAVKEPGAEATKPPPGQEDETAPKPVAKPVDAPPVKEAPDVPVNEPNPTGKKAAVEFYIMSRCFFGVQVMDGIHPLLKRVGEWVDFKLFFIGQELNGKLVSSHGEEEVQGDIIQLCLQHHFGADYRFMDTIHCMNRDVQVMPGNWEECATSAELDEEARGRLKTCYEGEEGEKLLRESFTAAREKKANSSPTVFIGGTAYRGGRSDQDLLRAICNEFAGGPAPRACADVPPPVAIKGIVLNDKRCKDRSCQTPQLELSFTNMFPGLKFRQLDYSEEEGRKLYDEEGLGFLPVLLFDAGIEKADSYSRLERFLKDSKSGKWKVFQGRARFDPAREVCGNGIDDTGNGEVDCADPTCKDTLECRPPTPGRLELYMVSQDPFGIKALDAMKPLMQAFGDEIRFELHFIGEEKDGQLVSRHGEGEVRENMRQLCAMTKTPPAKAMEYLWCRNKTLIEEAGAARKVARSDAGPERAAAEAAAAEAEESNWRACAKKSGVDAELIAACVTSEARGLLAADYKNTASLEIKPSPTWVVNGQVKFSAIAAKDIRDKICEHNPEFAGCVRELETRTP